MARHSLACVLALLALSSAKEQTRWSRQISSYTSDLTDWVPLPGPAPVEAPRQIYPQIKRQAVAEPRILAEPVFPGFQRPTGFNQEFGARNYLNSPSNRQLYLQSVPVVPSAPQNFLNDPGFGQGARFGLSQPNFPLNQAFVGPQFTFDTLPQKIRPNPIISNPVAFPKQNLPPPQSKPFINPAPRKPDNQKFIDGYRLENVSNFAFQKKPQSLQKLKFDNVPKTEMIPPSPISEREEVQLLYVPLESLNRGQYNFRGSQALQDTFINNTPRPTVNNPVPPKAAPAADFQRPLTHNIDHFNQGFFSTFNSQRKEVDQVPKFSTISTPYSTIPTTPKPKKLKPHQPPLAIFLTQEAKKGNQVKVGDVLTMLKNADSIAVLDSVDPSTAPKVFIGPSTLNPPDKYVKFELPYLSNIDHSEKKLRQLPFFVAPLSYNTPQGFAKIPFPSPHVGSVVINAQIKESATAAPTPIADVIPNSYSSSPENRNQEHKHVTQKPNISFYTTSPPKTNAPFSHQSNYYSIEPQTVSTVRPVKEPEVNAPKPIKTGSYFLSDINDQYNPAPIPNFDIRDNFRPQESEPPYNGPKYDEPTTQRTTSPSTTPKSSTYPNQLLETHNPYSINQAFHFSTPLDYHNLYDENYATPGLHQPSPPPSPSPSPSNPTQNTPRTTETVTVKTYPQPTTYQQPPSPDYVQNYNPEIQYESEIANQRYSSPKVEYTIKPAVSNYQQQSNQENVDVGSVNPPAEYNGNVNSNIEPQSAIENTENVNNNAHLEPETSTKSSYSYNQYETNYSEGEIQTSPTTSTTTTTTTRRPPLRNRGRPRYTTPKADSVESTTRTVVTRKPIRERRPLPPRSRYEPNKITTERATRKPVDSSESTTKYSRGRTRGRVHYKPSESDEYLKSAKHGHKDDLAYQRDVLHQNYPVTLMERSSTSDIEAITEPLPRISSTKVLEPATEVYDTENADSNDRAAISQHQHVAKEETYAQKPESQTETYQHTHEDYSYQSRSSLPPSDSVSNYEENLDKEGDYGRQATPPLKYESPESYSYATEPSSAVTEQSPSSYSFSDLSSKPEEVVTTPEAEITKVTKEHSHSHEEEPENNVVQTTPSFSRVRVRPGVVRQYHQASSTEATKKTERRRPNQPVTYRPAFDRRRTTMRIEEIEADLKTKQVHSRQDQEHRHPVYRPEPTTESSVTTPYSDLTTKRGVFRRRRPSYTTTSTSTESSNEAASTKRTYEVKNRFRGRRPNDKSTTEKNESQTEGYTTTVRTSNFNRYNRPSSRLSERFNKKQDQDTDDQDSNFSINRPKYIEPETDQWSPKLSSDNGVFKPYNPNDIVDDKKINQQFINEEQDIITARNEYDDMLISVTPATNTRGDKKIPEILPTLEALVEQSKTKGESKDTMSTFETMLEEVMKNLEEQDKDEYSSNVMKHKGGEIGEIPPERIISSGDSYRTTTLEDRIVTTEPTNDEATFKAEEKDNKQRRRGFWKKVKVRPVTEAIETAESQYYSNTVNHLPNSVNPKDKLHEKINDKAKVTTYKPPFEYLKDIFNNMDEIEEDILPTVDIPKIGKENKTVQVTEVTEASLSKETPTEPNNNPGDMDLGTGTPDPTVDNSYSTTESTTKTIDRTDGFSLMDYLFGITGEDDNTESVKEIQTTKRDEGIEITTETTRPRLPTTETTYIPEEITTPAPVDTTLDYEIKKIANDSSKTETEKSFEVESTTQSTYMDPNNVVSTSMSTEVSHETEICFRGKCIKGNKDMLL